MSDKKKKSKKVYIEGTTEGSSRDANNKRGK